MKPQVIYKTKTAIIIDFKHVLFVYFYLFIKRWCSDFIHIAATMLGIITQHPVHVLYQWPKRHASGLWFVRVILNANVGAVVVITCSVCMHPKSKATVATPVDRKALTHHVLHIALMGSNRNDGLFVAALEMSPMALCRWVKCSSRTQNPQWSN